MAGVFGFAVHASLVSILFHSVCVASAAIFRLDTCIVIRAGWHDTRSLRDPPQSSERLLLLNPVRLLGWLVLVASSPRHAATSMPPSTCAYSGCLIAHIETRVIPGAQTPLSA
eukprot:3098714-Rhodomonas_salina.1